MASRRPQAQPFAPPPPADLEAKKIEVVAERFVFKSPDGDWAVLAARETQNGDEVRTTGALAYVNVGEVLELDGRWENKPPYGFSFKVHDFRVTEPTSLVGIKAYLGSGALYGIGPAYAEKIVDYFGEETLTVLDTKPERLTEIAGIGPAKVESAIEHWEEMRATRTVMLFLQQHGAKPALAARIYKAYGDQSIARLKENPYQITELDRIGFITADAIAVAMGLPLNDPRRVDAGIVYVLEQSHGKGGHCFLPLAELLQETKSILKLEDSAKSAEFVDQRVRSLASNEKVILEPSIHGGRHVYTPRMWRAESRIAARIRGLVDSPGILHLPENLAPPQEDFTPTADQWKAIEIALRARLSILTGGPGVGKTASTKVLCDVLDQCGKKVALCAPTGKAAKKISEATGHEAKTIHRLLERQPFGVGGTGFARNAKNPLECDVLVVDEASMIDLPLADSLFQAIGESTHVVLVGDVDQLPPVGPGKVLQDVITSKRVPITHLKQIFRQARRSMIIQAAYAINSGRMPIDDPAVASQALGDNEEAIRDYFWIPREDNESILNLVLEYACERIPRKFGFDPKTEVQVVAPQRKTMIGVDALNRALQQRLNPHGEPIGSGGDDTNESKIRFRIGDKLLNTRNDYTHDVMNGEFAQLVSYNKGEALVSLDIEGRLVEMGVADATENFVLAYAVTVHKMQGSSSKAIVMPISMSYYQMLTRNLTYTAVTRAEEACIVIGQEQAMQTACKNNDPPKRHTALADRLLHPSLSGQLV